MSYKSEYPSGVHVDPEIKSFFENFYAISDTPGDHDKYVDQFAPDATFVLASNKSTGHEQIKQMRLGMWANVTSRKHTIPKIAPLNDSEFLLYGTVAFELKSGDKAALDWAGRAEIERISDDGKWRFKFYQVYLDTGALNAYRK
ncbi:fungal specific transcription factor [Emericellopsis cladophorae]|uniref:Fungal specific transcription factor n=1 Tax=Emericellopsis cladophorae TaxID=2686198 RepID=A0A9P9Y0Z5_9HYPO|nr:fungal specific transcription factor [Emericellopsis cladophorae]KAI6781178.1 fungal specific transcription factor [Emericellopsis cladophorae]